MMKFCKIYFLVPEKLYYKVAVKTNGFKDIDAVMSDLIVEHLLSEEELAEC
jgi:hypothetical protein